MGQAYTSLHQNQVITRTQLSVGTESTWPSSQILVVNTSTGEVDQLTNNQDNNFSPSVDGTGGHVAFQGSVAGFTQLFLAIQVSGTVGGATIPEKRFALLAPFLVAAA